MLILSIVLLFISACVWIASHISCFKDSQVKQGILLGVAAIVANTLSADFGNMKISVGLIDAPPMIAGLFFGPVAGIISGSMAAIERALTPLWGVGTATWLRCSVATFVVSIYAIVLSKLVFDEVKPSIITAFVAVAFGEILHLALLFVWGWNTPSLTCEIIYAAILPMTMGAGIAGGIASVICAWRGWRKSFFNRMTGAFLLFGVTFGFIVAVALYSANLYTSRLLTHGMADFNKKINDHVGFALHRSTRTIMQSIGSVCPLSVEKMKAYADEYHLDEISIIDKDGTIIASNCVENLQYHNFLRSNKIVREFFDLIDGKEKVVKQSFRISLTMPAQVECFVGVAFPDRKGILQVGYKEDRFVKEFEHLFLPQLKDTPLFFNGYFLIFDEKGQICCPVYKHPEAYRKSARAIGFTDDELKYPLKSSFYARIFGKWSRCVFGRQIGQWRIYVVLPLYDLYAPMMRIIFISGLCLFFLCLLFRWTIVKMIISQRKVDELNAQKEARNKRDMLLAYHVQKSELKEDNPDTDFYKITAFMQPAKEVGGDFYDHYVLSDGKVVIGIADVSGKGIPAAIFMMKAKTTLKFYSYRCGSIKEVMERANNELCRKNAAQMFVTCWEGIFDPETGDLEYISAGHNPPLVRHADGSVEWVNGCKSLPLGVRAQYSYKPQKIRLNHGDRIFLYTDGVTETMNAEKELYGNQRLYDIVGKIKDDDLIKDVFEDLKNFTKGSEQWDDITMLSMLIK